MSGIGLKTVKYLPLLRFSLSPYLVTGFTLGVGERYINGVALGASVGFTDSVLTERVLEVDSVPSIEVLLFFCELDKKPTVRPTIEIITITTPRVLIFIILLSGRRKSIKGRPFGVSQPRSLPSLKSRPFLRRKTKPIKAIFRG